MCKLNEGTCKECKSSKNMIKLDAGMALQHVAAAMREQVARTVPLKQERHRPKYLGHCPVCQGAHASEGDIASALCC